MDKSISDFYERQADIFSDCASFTPQEEEQLLESRGVFQIPLDSKSCSSANRVSTKLFPMYLFFYKEMSMLVEA
jgi:hypothetical protein